jgi:hypothetical protein
MRPADPPALESGLCATCHQVKPICCHAGGDAPQYCVDCCPGRAEPDHVTSRATRVPMLIALALVLSLPGSALASKDLTIVSGSRDVNGVLQPHYPAVEYAISPEHDAAGRVIAASLASWIAENPNRPIPIVIHGQSTTSTVAQRLLELVNRINTDEAGLNNLRRPGVKIIKCGIGGVTGDSWADPDNPAWPTCKGRVEEAGYSVNDVILGIGFVTQGFPLDAGVGVMTAARVASIIQSFQTHFPSTLFYLLAPSHWTGQSNELGRAPGWSTAGDQYAMLANVGISPGGVWVDYICTYADGNVPTNCAASSMNPPVSYDEFDTGNDAVHFPGWGGVSDYRAGADKVARAIAGYLRDRPYTWFLWTDTQPPDADPPPPPPDPVYGELNGAQRKWYQNACTVVWGTLEAPLPASWCAGL